MPVVMRHNESLELNLAEYLGSVTYGELKAVAEFLAANPSFLKRDCLSVAYPGCDFDSIDLAALDELFGGYAQLYAPINFQIIRRSAWVCLSPAAQRYIDYWIVGRDARGAMSTTLRQFPTHEEAGDWLVLSEAETLALQTRAGFDVVVRFEDKPPAVAAHAR
ncbi:hypothetical protein ATE48_02840 [Candidatus Viadribacter manganicus]|uniref:Uncharacterized protein n=1 Tax=Candidatus Viadribacter manganicus TaxID=1759059 RepID=A0A1B1AEF8_9PROT|nr:hypothetical protein ATE48_02840 [Candidatus Viadribacter manganicus]